MRNHNHAAHASRLEERVREQVSLILRDDVHDPVLLHVRLVRVHVGAGGSNVDLHYVSPLSERELRERLNRVAAFLRRELCQALPMKRTPLVRFSRVNVSAEEGDH